MSGHLTLLYGGPSAEHEVSCVSALHVLRSARSAGFEVAVIGVAHDGRWFEIDASIDDSATTLPSPDGLEGNGGNPLELLSAATPTVVFPLIHGTMGEDGTVQGAIEVAGLPYVGAGILASAVCMDKLTFKRVLATTDIGQTPFVSVTSADDVDTASSVGFPCFVKPSALGSSVGVSRVDSPDELPKALAQALEFDEVAIVEEAIVGREIEFAVLGNAEPRVSIPGEILPSHDFYDFEDKYELGTAGLVVPAPMEPEVRAAGQALAERTYRLFRVDGMARVDMFLRPDGEWLVNEINTLPGFTPISMYPRLWAESGLVYEALITELVDLARARFHQRSGRRITRLLEG